MASTAYDQSIRQSLNDKGIGNGQIGYKNGYVTVNGQNFMKADKNYNGSAYTSAQNFNNAWNSYSAPKATTPTTTSSYKAPTVTPGSVGVRSALESSGYNPNSIGYSNGTVTLNNQPFVTPSANVNGTTYTDPSTYKNALSNYRIGDLQNQIVNNTNLPTNQYTSQIDDTIKYLMDFAKNQQVSNPYDTAEYKAYQAQSDRRAQQGIRAAQESMGSSGFGRSTALGERAQGIQNEQTEYLETQVIPTILAAERERQQQQYSNVMNLLNPLMNQQSYADNRAQTELSNVYNALNAVTSEQQRGYDNARADAALTGTYLTPAQQEAINTLLGLKQQAEAKGTTKEQRDVLTKQADAVRNNMIMLGLDPTQYGSNVSYNVASQNTPGRTLQGQQLDMQKEQFDYQKARDAITDKQWQMKFDEDARQFGLNYALNQLQESNQNAYRQANLALSRDQFDWEQGKDIANAEANTLAKAGQTMSIQDYTKTYVNPIVQRDEDGNIINKNEVIATVLAGKYGDNDTDSAFGQYSIYKNDIDNYQKYIKENGYSGN